MELKTKKIIAREELVFAKCFIPIVLILKNPFDDLGY